MRMLRRYTGKGRPTNKFTSSGAAVNRHQENLVNFAASMIVEVSLRTGVQNIVAIHRQGRQCRAFLLVRFRSLSLVRSLPHVPLALTVASRALVGGRRGPSQW